MLKDVHTVWLTTNRSCNNQCEWCYAKGSVSNNMDIETAMHVIDELQQSNVKRIILIGGEPSLYPKLMPIIRYISGRGMHVGMASNGICFSDKRFAQDAKKSGLESVNISIKGLNEQEYWENTGNVSGYGKMMQGYQNLTEAGITSSFSYVLVRHDAEYLDRVIEFIVKENLHNIFFQLVKPQVAKDSFDIMELREMGHVIEYLYGKLEGMNVDYQFEVSIPFCLVDQVCLHKLLQEKRIVSGCHIQSGSGLVYDPEFKVLPCNHFVGLPFDHKSYTNRDSIDELLCSDSVERFRRKASCYPSQKCIDCVWWDKCGGGCFTRWLYLDPTIEIPGINQEEKNEK